MLFLGAGHTATTISSDAIHRQVVCRTEPSASSDLLVCPVSTFSLLLGLNVEVFLSQSTSLPLESRALKLCCFNHFELQHS